MDEEEKIQLNSDISHDSDSNKVVASVSDTPQQADNSANTFFDIDKLAEDFEKMNFEIFGETAQNIEFAPEAEFEMHEIPSDEETKNAPVKNNNSNPELVINIPEKKKSHREEKKEKKQRANPYKQSKKQKQNIEKESSPYSDKSLMQMLYLLVYSFGFNTIRYTKAIVYSMADMVSKPFVIFFKALGTDKKKNKRKFKYRVENLMGEITEFHGDTALARQAFRKVYRDPERLKKAFKLYLSHIRKNHRHVLKTATNTILPIVAALIFAFTSTYWNDLTFALEVNYNNKSLGYINDESVYMEAQNLIGEKLDTGAYSFEGSGDSSDISSLDAQYKLKLVSLDDLNDAETICDRVIESSADSLTTACGIYIDGKFIGALKNEADAKTVFHNYLSPYLADAEKEGYVVGFAEDIEYRQGIYSETESIIIDPNRLNEIIHSKKTVQLEYRALSTDSLESISLASGVSQERLMELNPSFNWNNIKNGERITYEKQTTFLRIQKTVISTEVVDVPFETITTKDSTKYAGYSKVTRPGVPGKNRVTTTKIFVEGVLTNTLTDVTVVTSPITEIKIIGGMSYYGDVVIGTISDYGFLWPAPSCNYISSPYGYRSSGFHKGVDLCRTDRRALGTSVVASRDGVVEYAGWNDSGYGYMVLINHGDGYKTRYGHMLAGSICVSVGDYVYAGQQIGRVGSTGNSTGPHLHFEVIYYGDKLNPMNFLARN